MTSEFEGWPLALTEAQSNGVVPVAFECSAGVGEILGPDNQYGILIKPNNLKEFACQLNNLMKDPDRIAKMRNNVIEKSKEYSPEVVGQNWIKLINTLTDRK